MPENKPPEKPSPRCFYCQKDSFYIHHRNKKGETDWAICKDCLKKLCDKVLGEGKDGGRVK
jgi:hypothetical protein